MVDLNSDGPLVKIQTRFPVKVASSDLAGTTFDKVNKPFQTYVSDSTLRVCIPKNFEELVEANWLFRLYNSVLIKQGYKSNFSTENFNTKLKTPSIDERLYLEALGVVCFSDTVPLLPRRKTTIYKGYVSGMKLWISHQKNIDSNLIKASQSISPVKYLLGDDYGRGYPNEKKIIDHIINFIKNRSFRDSEYLSNYLLSKNEIVNHYKLFIDIKNQLVTPAEKDWINSSLDVSGHNKWNYDMKLVVSANAIRSLLKSVHAEQKELKPYKKLLSSMISSRISAAFSPYSEKEKKKIKIKKTPLKALIEKVKGTVGYSAFNPTVVFTLNKMPQLQAYYPSSEENRQQVKADMDSLLSHRFGKNIDQYLFQNIFAEYSTYLENTDQE